MWPWRRSSEVDPAMLQATDPAVLFVQDVLAGTAPPLGCDFVSDAVALQVYEIFCGDDGPLRHMGFESVYRVLGSLKHGKMVQESIDKRLLNDLKQRFERAGSNGRNQGLVKRFRSVVRQRSKLADTKTMSAAAARLYTLSKWEEQPFGYAFTELQAAGGDGGGDPEGSAAAVEEAAAPAPWDLDIRTRTLEVQLLFVATAQRTRYLRLDRACSHWHVRGGELPPDVLRLIDGHVRAVELPTARREETYQLRMIRAHERIDEQLKRITELEAEVWSKERAAVQALRARDAACGEADAQCRAAREQDRVLRAELASSLKEARGSAATRYRALQKEMQSERVIKDQVITRLEAQITDLERTQLRLRAAMRGSQSSHQVELAKAEAELHKAREGRIWAAVAEERARRELAEKQRDEAQAEAERLAGEARARGGGGLRQQAGALLPPLPRQGALGEERELPGARQPQVLRGGACGGGKPAAEAGAGRRAHRDRQVQGDRGAAKVLLLGRRLHHASRPRHRRRDHKGARLA